MSDRTVAYVAALHKELMESWWYLSFSGEEGFRGATLVRGYDIVSAAMTALFLGCNPGGQILGLPVTNENELPPPKFRDRLLSLGDLEQLFPEGVNMITVRRPRRDDE
jgi:hypothetical protein